MVNKLVLVPSVQIAYDSTEAPRIAVIAGAIGYRRVLTAFILSQWPDADIEEVDPFSQTMRDAGITFGTHCDVMVLAGIGTRAEALSALSRLRAFDQQASENNSRRAPPVIMLVSYELFDQAPALREAGAAAVLAKDSLSRQRLIDTIAALSRARVVETEGDAEPIPDATEGQFGNFSFDVDGDRVVVSIEGYRSLKTLTANAMASVFLAERIDDRKRAVVKVAVATPYHQIATADRFSKRFRFIHGLNGEGVVRYLDAGITGSWPYVVLEYLTAGDLRSQMAKGITTIAAVEVLNELASALSTLHGGKFAHMDIKPENIFFREDGSLALIDFNISTPFQGVARNSTTGEVLGSPFYMSPEQGQGLAVDGRSDLYSAGVIFFEMLTGLRPFEGENSTQVIFKHIHDEIPLLPKRVRELQPIIDRLLAKNPSERFPSGLALMTALRPHIDRLTTALNTPPSDPAV